MSVTKSEQSTLEALDARFQERRQQVPVLAQRADAEGIKEIRSLEDMVPLLLPHMTYKSYPEQLVAKGQWAQMNRWLDSLSTYRVDYVDVDGVADVDGWIDRLEAAGHLVSSSSGTSGKSSFLNKTKADRQVSLANLVDCLVEQGVPPERSWHVVPVGPVTGVSSHNAVRDMIIETYSRPDGITVAETKMAEGHHRYMARLAAMRRAMADGTAQPDEVAALEAEATQRQTEVEARLQYIASAVLVHRTERLFFSATFPMLFRLTEILRERGVSEGEITGENAMTTGGGLKGMTLPPDYQSQCFKMMHISPSRFLHYYSMQEINVRMPKCSEGRYHVPPTLTLFVLNQDGDALAPVSDGQVEGRAAFFDMTVDGRWGGTISGDKIHADFGACPCGRPGPTVFDDITRYINLPDGDKITCAGTIDAYVRGFIES
jgi:hypothetical protein